MAQWTDDQIEAMLTPETRRVVMPDGSTRELTHPYVLWNAYDELVEAGCEPETLVTHAEMPGWDPPNLPFELRFSSVVADTYHRWLRRSG